LPHDFLRNALTPLFTAAIYRTEDETSLHSSGRCPGIHRHFHPCRNGNGTNASMLAVAVPRYSQTIHNPPLVALPDRQCTSDHPIAECAPVQAQPLRTCVKRNLSGGLKLPDPADPSPSLYPAHSGASAPAVATANSRTNTRPLGTSHATNCRSYLWCKQPIFTSFMREFANQRPRQLSSAVHARSITIGSCIGV
jgi:hypothetical protein